MSETPTPFIPAAQDPARDEKGKFVPGHTGIGGRPKGSISFATAIKKKMAEIPVGQTKDWLTQIVETMLQEAIAERNMKAIELLIAYVDGKPRQNIGLDGGVDGSPIIVAVETQEMAKKAIEAFLNQDQSESDIQTVEETPEA